MAYDAIRGVLGALLAAQGLRVTSAGGHRAYIESLTAQFSQQQLGVSFAELDSLRQLRNDSEYPQPDLPSAYITDAKDALRVAKTVLGNAKKMVPDLLEFPL